MKIGFISHWYDPEGGAAAGPGTIARALSARGHDVHVLTGYPIYPHGRVFDGYRQRPYLRETLEGVTVHRAPIYPSHDDRAGHRMANYLSFATSGAALAQALLGSMDVVFVYSTPATAAIPALGLKALRRIPYVVHIQDLWPQTVTASDFVQSESHGMLERALHHYCDLVYRSAHSVAVTSPSMASLIQDREISPEKIHFIPNWADESAFYPMEPKTELREEFGLRRELTVMYAGNFGDLQDLTIVLRAAAALTDEPRVEFVLVGAGTEEDSLRAEASALGLDNVRFVGPQPFSRMAEVLSVADVQLVTLKDRPLFRSTLPSKLQANLAVGKPIISSAAGDAAEIVTRSEAGIVVAPGDPAAMAGAVRHLLDEGTTARRQRGQRAREYYLEHFSTAAISGRLEGLLFEAAQSRRSR